MALFAGLGRLLLEADDRAPGTRRSTATSSTATVRISPPTRRSTRAVDLDTVLEATGIERAAAGAGRRR